MKCMTSAVQLRRVHLTKNERVRSQRRAFLGNGLLVVASTRTTGLHFVPSCVGTGTSSTIKVEPIEGRSRAIMQLSR